MTDKEFIENIDKIGTDELFDTLEYIGCDGYYYGVWRAIIEELKKRVVSASCEERQNVDVLNKIPKDFVYDTETSEFYCYRNKYTGEEIHIIKQPKTYILVDTRGNEI